MVSEENRGNVRPIEAQSEEAPGATGPSRGRRLVSRLGLFLVGLGALLVHLGLPARQPAEK